jgi:hypothetical protein
MKNLLSTLARRVERDPREAALALANVPYVQRQVEVAT